MKFTKLARACPNSQLTGVFNFSRSGLNLTCKPGKSQSAKINRIRRNFINERVMLSWNKLPSDVKMASSLNMFKSNLELYKNKTRALGISGSGNYWEISDDVLYRIEGGSYSSYSFCNETTGLVRKSLNRKMNYRFRNITVQFIFNKIDLKLTSRPQVPP